MKRLLNLNDKVACKIQNPYPAEISAVLKTWESVVFGQKLVDSGKWYIVEQIQGPKRIS